jgi:hypothetical protein
VDRTELRAFPNYLFRIRPLKSFDGITHAPNLGERRADVEEILALPHLPLPITYFLVEWDSSSQAACFRDLLAFGQNPLNLILQPLLAELLPKANLHSSSVGSRKFDQRKVPFG